MKNKAILMSTIMAVFVFAMQFVLGACYSNGEEVPCGSVWWIFIVFGLMGLVFLFLFIFWILMLVHAIKHDNPNKVVWILVIILTNWLGAIIYYFAVKRKMQQ